MFLNLGHIEFYLVHKKWLFLTWIKDKQTLLLDGWHNVALNPFYTGGGANFENFIDTQKLTFFSVGATLIVSYVNKVPVPVSNYT